MLGNMMVGLNRKILSLYVKLGVRLGHWSSLEQVYIDSKGMTGRRLYADWHIPTEEYEKS
tara:strand:- start:381 stop:560 length:180 start_codon:yes stop_codon:yes gene_type:complete